MGSKKIIFLPSVARKGGFGHLKRCLSLAEALKGMVYWPEEPGCFRPEDLKEIPPGVTLIRELADTQAFDLAVLDRRETSSELAARIKSLSRVVIGMDEGGKGRADLPFLLDILGNLSSHAPNLLVPTWSAPGKPRTVPPGKTVRLLVSFGGEDPKDLTGKFHRLWTRWGRERPEDVTVVLGPLFRHIRTYEGWKVLRSPENLGNLLPEYTDLVTSYGLTAWEGVNAGLRVILMNPSRYHEKLARKSGFSSLRNGPYPSLREWEKLWQSRETTPLDTGAASAPAPSLEAFLENFSATEDKCPVCRSRNRKVLHRAEHKTYSLCRECSMVYLTAYNLPTKAYVKSYFHEEYKKQYGRTYLEDFDHIKSMGAQRVAVLRSLGLSPGDQILDAGCAYGPFLSAARDAGLNPAGLDVATDAVDYLTSVLKIPAVEKSLLDLNWSQDFPRSGPLKALTLWYVIEHFPNLHQVLSVLNQNLALGGLLGFSTPNGRGITGLFTPEKFFRESPEDHFSLWSPRIAGKVLPRYGFKIERIRITGHHPERFPGLKPGNTFGKKIIGLLSELGGWGDTFEVYARKVKDFS